MFKRVNGAFWDWNHDVWIIYWSLNVIMMYSYRLNILNVSMIRWRVATLNVLWLAHVWWEMLFNLLYASVGFCWTIFLWPVYNVSPIVVQFCLYNKNFSYNWMKNAFICIEGIILLSGCWNEEVYFQCFEFLF